MNKLRRYKQKHRRSIRREWETECLKYRGCILKGKFAHFCWDWDGLPVDENCIEFTCCNCLPGTEEFIKAIVACKIKFDRLHKPEDLNDHPITR